MLQPNYSAICCPVAIAIYGGDEVIQNTIRDLCQKKGISLAELARESGVPYSTLKKWGVKPKQPSAISVVKVCKALGTTAEELMRGEE